MRTEEQKNNIRALIRTLEKNPMKYEGEYIGRAANECCALGYALLACPDVSLIDESSFLSTQYHANVHKSLEDCYGFSLTEQNEIAEENDNTEGWKEVIHLLKTYL